MTPETDQSFDLRSSLNLRLEHVGCEQEPVLIVEGLLQKPDALVEYAASQVSFSRADAPDGGYPGLRAPAPLNYVEKVVRALQAPMSRAFGLANAKLSRAQCNFSMVTRRAGELAPLQRIPHVDTTDSLQFAILHYLCGPAQGGTAFYRHRATGFETITDDRLASYEDIRDEELRSARAESGYIRSDSPHYVQTAAFEAAFDRVLIYRSRVLHSGMIPAEMELEADPRKGRLTANIFVNFRPPN